ncbi:MAG: molybdopterin-dependent oxidoreductase [Proteobacteria bacterium]|nr:molybdopterin-dependent oxidoreductase [Pseudomonadota bacterium]
MSDKLTSSIVKSLQDHKLDRRTFLKLSGISGAGFVLASAFPNTTNAADNSSLVGSVDLNAYVSVGEDGKIVILSGTPEMGQGIKTSLPMIVAEEMGANWDDVTVVQTSIVDTDKYGNQGTGGSYTVNANFNLMRQMGATARDMFLSAGALSMELPKQELKAENSVVFHPSSGQSRTFRELVAIAYKQPVPAIEDLVFKGRQEYRIIGTAKSQVDSLDIVTGLGDFGIDTRVPEMLYGAYVKSPSVGGKLISANIEEIRREPGIIDAYLIKGNGEPRELMDGVGIVGTSTWAVFKAKEKVRVRWDETLASRDSWTGFKKYAESIDSPTGDREVVSRGEVDQVFADDSNSVIDSFYEFPYVSHMCLEPMNCTAHFKPGTNGSKDHLEVWLPTQNGPRFQTVAEKLYGLSKAQLTINIKRMGGSFGRRTSFEYACEAIELSKRSGKPVNLTWSREDSIKHDYFRVGGFQKLRAAINVDSQVVGWEEHAIVVEQKGKLAIGSGFRDGAFPLSNFPTARGTMTLTEMNTLVGPWRAPWSNTHAFVTQCFIHEIAVATGRDHAELLLEMLGEPRWLEEGNIRAMNTGRSADVIKLATEKAGWGREMPAGRGLGLSFYFCHAAHIAEVAEVSVDENKKLTVHKVTVAVDVGPIVNMSGALNQVQGSVIDGLSTMVGQKITMENGIIEQTNLHQYPVLRIAAAPEVEVHFIQSDNEPTGLGEPGLPPLAPAVANAIFAATGERVRKMPLVEEGFSV